MCIEKCVLFVIRHNCISHLILFTVQPLFEFSSVLWTPLDHPLFWTQWYLVRYIFTNAQGLSECQMTYTKYILSDMESKYAEVSSLLKSQTIDACQCHLCCEILSFILTLFSWRKTLFEHQMTWDQMTWILHRLPRAEFPLYDRREWGVEAVELGDGLTLCPNDKNVLLSGVTELK